MDLRIHHHTEVELVAEAGPLFLRILNGAVTTNTCVDRLLKQLDDMLERWPIVAIIVVVEHGTPHATPEIRRRVDTDLRRYGDRIVVGYALLGLGFWGVDAKQFGAERAAELATEVYVESSLVALAGRLAFDLVGVDPGVIVSTCEQLRAELGLGASEGP